jgi:hypothetical protein
MGGADAIWRTVMGVLFIALVGNGLDLLGVILLLAVGSTPDRGRCAAEGSGGGAWAGRSALESVGMACRRVGAR